MPAKAVWRAWHVHVYRLRLPPDPTLVSGSEGMVVRFADPGWTPLLPHVRAVVMEVGGIMCYAAVVAREMGVPAVSGIRDATGLLRDGKTVEVDGGLGVVIRLMDPGRPEV